MKVVHEVIKVSLLSLKYVGLKVEMERMWDTSVRIIPVVVGALGSVTRNLKRNLQEVPGTPLVHMCQKICLMGSEKIARSVLSR